MDVTKVVKSWLRNQPEEEQALLEGWLDDLFLKSVDYILNDWSSVVPTTRAGLILSALSQLQGCKSKAEFVGALIRGLPPAPTCTRTLTTPHCAPTASPMRASAPIALVLTKP